MHFGILNIIILFHFGKLFTIYIEMISHRTMTTNGHAIANSHTPHIKKMTVIGHISSAHTSRSIFRFHPRNISR